MTVNEVDPSTKEFQYLSCSRPHLLSNAELAMSQEHGEQSDEEKMRRRMQICIEDLGVWTFAITRVQ